MMRARPTRGTAVVLAAVVVLATGCDGSSDSDTSEPDDVAAELTAEQGDEDPEVATSPPDDTVDDEDGGGAEAGSTTSTSLRPGVVALDGSVEEVLLELDEASRFAAGVDAWLTAVPGQEGVLRNSTGITVFVPVDDGFGDDARDLAFADPDRSALTLSDHLRVGVLDELDAPVVVASGKEYAVTVDDGVTLVDGRRVVGTVTATNGVIHLVDGLLGTDDG